MTETAPLFWSKLKDGKSPPIIIIDPPYKSAGAPYAGTRTGRFSAGTPLYKRGDWVLWKQEGVGPGRIARVSRVDHEHWPNVPTFHLRLRTPVEGPYSRRWAYAARTFELQHLEAVSALGDLLARLTC